METLKPPEALCRIGKEFVQRNLAFRQGFFILVMERNKRNILIFFAGLWAFVEVSLGTVLSLSKVPFRGMLMASFACFILISFRVLNHTPRSSIYLATIVSVVKLIFSFGAGALNSAIAIFIEGLIAEIIFSLIRVNLFSSILAGALVVLYPFFHSLFTQTVIFGVDIFKLYNRILSELQQILKINNTIGVLELILFFSILYLLIGSIVGASSFWFSKNVLTRIIHYGKQARQ